MLFLSFNPNQMIVSRRYRTLFSKRTHFLKKNWAENCWKTWVLWKQALAWTLFHKISVWSNFVVSQRHCNYKVEFRPQSSSFSFSPPAPRREVKKKQNDPKNILSERNEQENYEDGSHEVKLFASHQLLIASHQFLVTGC